MPSTETYVGEQERHVANLPGDYEVTAVKVQPTAHAVHMLVVQNADLLPYPGEGRWHHDIFERACDCGGDCLMAWCCALFPLAQIAEKHKKLGVNYHGFRGVAVSVLIVLVIELIFAVITRTVSFNGFHILTIVICFQLRAMTRKILGIDGSCCDDCVLSTFCTPCTVIQIVDSLWTTPKITPGCSFDARVAEIV
mmetsp:Transcript_30358/g.60813  ORF Transcript_30358/g.60813 Transcript_30358/m.60813 type:complete len:195 (+) Transcript_30358:47-631(+)